MTLKEAPCRSYSGTTVYTSGISGLCALDQMMSWWTATVLWLICFLKNTAWMLLLVSPATRSSMDERGRLLLTSLSSRRTWYL